MGARALKNVKHEAFCQEYLVDFNKTQAYLRVYPKTNENSANSSAVKLTAKPSIQERIKELADERSKLTLMNAEFVVNKLRQVAEADFVEWADLGREGVDKQTLDDMPKEIRTMVQSIERTDKKVPVGHGNYEIESTYKFKLMDKTKCTELLGKHVGAFKEVIEGKVDHTHTLADLVDEEDE